MFAEVMIGFAATYTDRMLAALLRSRLLFEAHPAKTAAPPAIIAAKRKAAFPFRIISSRIAFRLFEYQRGEPFDASGFRNELRREFLRNAHLLPHTDGLRRS